MTTTTGAPRAPAWGPVVLVYADGKVEATAPLATVGPGI